MNAASARAVDITPPVTRETMGDCDASSSSSSSSLRRRSKNAVATVLSSSQPPAGGVSSGPIDPFAASITIANLLKASPQQHGYVKKLHIPFLYWVLPNIVRRILATLPFLRRSVVPTWRDRYLVLLGSYIYKFAWADGGLDDEKNKRRSPKGSPIAVVSISNSRIVDISGSATESEYDLAIKEALQSLPAQALSAYTYTCFAVERFDKTTYYAVDSFDMAFTWKKAVETAKQEAIRRNMGHAPPDSIPPTWIYYDSIGKQLVRSKERVRARLDHAQLREMEMSSLMSEAGGGAGTSFPRGYYS
jgi:hypothetical protein